MMKARILRMMKLDEELALLREARDSSNHIGALDLFPLSPDLGHSDDGNLHESHSKSTHNHTHHASDGPLIHHGDVNPNITNSMSHKISAKKHNHHRVSSSSRSIVKKPDRTLILNPVQTNNPLRRNRLNVAMTGPTNTMDRLSRDGRQLHEVFRKKLTSSDVSCQQDRLLMSKDRRGCLGMHNTPSPENQDVIVDMWDESDGRKYSFVHGLWTSNGSYVLKGKWRSFCDFKRLNVGDVIVISMDDSDGTLWIRHERGHD